MERPRQGAIRLSLAWIHRNDPPPSEGENLDSVEIFAPTRDNVRQIIYGVSREQLLEDELLLAGALRCSILPSDWQDWLVITPTRTLRTGLPSTFERR